MHKTSCYRSVCSNVERIFMKTFRKITIFLLVISTVFCFVGCGERFTRSDRLSEAQEIDVAGVYIEDYTGGKRYRYLIDDKTDANEIFNEFLSFDYQEDSTAKAGASYILFRFYDKEWKKECVYVIYENGVCCIGRDYDTFYTIENGRTVYMDLADMYENSENIMAAEDYKGK